MIAPASTVGIIVNPLAGTDIRRLSAPAGHTSHAAKVGIVQKIAVAAIEAGARRVLLGDDGAGLARRAAQSIGIAAEVIADIPADVHSRSIVAAQQMWKRGCAVVVAVGGDGTCRDVAVGWPGVPLIAVSTGTNNVYPQSIDPIAAGSAAGLIAAGQVPLDYVSRPSKRLSVLVGDQEYIALVDVAVLDGTVVGSRAVLDIGTVRSVVAAISSPLASGLSSIAGRVMPIDGDDPDAVVVDLGGATASRRTRVPLVPGRFATVEVAATRRLRRGAVECFVGPAVLAFDGERDVVLYRDETAFVTVDDGGPMRIDVERSLGLAVHRRLFDLPGAADGP
jgi:hypothetical protein